MSSSRIAAIVVVALLHALLGYAFVSGLAFNVVKKVAQDLKTFNVEEPPPPEEEPPPPPPETPQVETPPPPLVAPPPQVRMQTPPLQMQTVSVAPPNPPITPTATPAPPAPPAPPPPPPPPPAKKVESARAKGNLAALVSDSDYPASAVRAEEEGSTGFRLEVGANGRVTACTVTSSSGSSALDAATCRIMKSRARFTPAIDSNGNPTSDTVSNRITWKLQ